ncbi:MAG: N-acetylglucosamine-6-phosphate deacetylase, partial [Pseudomonadota bacterium]
MSQNRVHYRGGRIFNGNTVLCGHSLVVEDGLVVSLAPSADTDEGVVVELEGDLLAPGFVDLQVNGGGGVMFNHTPCVGTLRVMAEAHRRLGSAAILATLITDRAEVTTAAIAAVERAVAEGVEGIAGLHLEGPHLSVARKGAHDGSLIRVMSDADLAELCEAARRLPALMVTVAPESVTTAQVEALVDAGAIVSLGHTDAGYDTCVEFMSAGARCVTHLFNAMRQLGSREPGLVGAALRTPRVSAGVIADGVHVHPLTLQTLWTAKHPEGRLFLV